MHIYTYTAYTWLIPFLLNYMLVNSLALKYLEIHTSYIYIYLVRYIRVYIYSYIYMHCLLLPKRNRKTPAVYAPCRMSLASNGSSLSLLGPNWQQHRRSASRCLRDTASSVVEHVWSPRYFCREPTFSDVVFGGVLIQSGNSCRLLPREAVLPCSSEGQPDCLSLACAA
jgi:hypothetical protein